MSILLRICGTAAFSVVNSMKTIKTNIEKRTVEITFSIPFVNKTSPKQMSIDYAANIVGAFRDYLVLVLEARMHALTNNLILHKDDVTFNNGELIAYSRKDNTSVVFDLNKYKAAEEAVERLNKEDYIKFITKPSLVKQVLEGLPWVEKPEDNRGSFKYSDLVSVLVNSL